MVLVSVVMSSYNHGKYIAEAIESVLSQSHRDLELIIVDDYSKDSSTEIIETYKSRDRRIRSIVHKENLGIYRTLNDGVQFAQGKFIAIINSDDVWEKIKLERQLGILEKNDDLVVWSEGEVIDQNSRLTGENFTHKQGASQQKKNGDIFEELLYGNFIFSSSIIFKKILHCDIRFNEKLKYLGDYRFVIDLAKKHKFYFIEEPLAKYRTHGKNTQFYNWKDWQRDEIAICKYFIDECRQSIPKKAKSNILFRMGRACYRIGQRERAHQLLLSAIQINFFSKNNILYLAVALGAEDIRIGQAFIDSFYLVDSFLARILGKPTPPLWWWRFPPHRLFRRR